MIRKALLNKKFTTKIILFFSFILIAVPAYANQTFLYLFADPKAAGDRDQVIGIANSLKEICKNNYVEKEFKLSQPEDFLSEIKKASADKNNTVVAMAPISKDSAKILKKIPHQKNILLILSSHQFTEEARQLIGVANVMVLPRHVISKPDAMAFRSSSTQLIKTIGVVHSYSTNEIEKAYQEHKNSLPKADKYTAVILGGDAPTPEGKMLYYTPEEAKKLADYLAQIIRKDQSHLLILNGPRTGKHDPKTGKELPNSHRNGNIDPVTQTFVQELTQKGLVEGKNFTLFDFQHGQPSLFKAVLGALRVNNRPIYVAGESTSMVSQAVDCLPRGSVTVYWHQAVNKAHKRHTGSEKAAGRVNILKLASNGKWKLSTAKTLYRSSILSASQYAAKAICTKMKRKSLKAK